MTEALRPFLAAAFAAGCAVGLWYGFAPYRALPAQEGLAFAAPWADLAKWPLLGAVIGLAVALAMMLGGAALTFRAVLARMLGTAVAVGMAAAIWLGWENYGAISRDLFVWLRDSERGFAARDAAASLLAGWQVEASSGLLEPAIRWLAEERTTLRQTLTVFQWPLFAVLVTLFLTWMSAFVRVLKLGN